MASRTAPANAPVVMFTPLPPQPNGIADYSFELLTVLAREIPCTVVVEDGCIDARAPRGVEVLQLVDYMARMDAFADATHVYHLGNNPDHVYCLPVIAARPGLLVIHDPALHHLLDCATVARGDAAAYADALAAEYGAPGRVLARQFRAAWLREQRMYFDMPMLRGLAGPAKGVIVHSRYAAAKVLAQVPDAAVRVVPHQFSPPPSTARRTRAEVRQGLGVGEGEILFASLGFVGRSKQIDAALRALAASREKLPPFRYLIAGEFRPHEVDILGLARALGLTDLLITPGYIGEDDFFAFLDAADVVINLRHPVGGETSGTMIRALGVGACTVVVDRGAFAEIPDGAAVKLRWGPGFDARLADALLELARDAALRARIGAAAREATLRENAIGRTLAGYRAAIAHAAAAPARPWASPVRWRTLPPQTRPGPSPLPLWAALGAVPEPDRPARVIALGDNWPASHLLPEGVAAGIAAGTRPLDDFLAAPPPPRSADLVLLAADGAHLEADAAPLLAAINRALALGGVLVASLRRDVAGPRTPLERRGAGTGALEMAGFTVTLGDTAPPPDPLDTGSAAAPAVEERVWRAVKSSEFIARTHPEQAA